MAVGSRSSCASVSSSGAYLRYHHANPALTSSRFGERPSDSKHLTHRAPIAVTIQDVHGDGLPGDQRGRELLGPLAEHLPLFRAVNAVQSDAFALALVQHRDGVAVCHSHHATGEVGGEGG